MNCCLCLLVVTANEQIDSEKISEDITSVMNILHVANMFGMSALEENCCTYLKNVFSLESVLDIFYFCKSHGDAFLSLEAKVTNWIAR